jgi:hypothetical protein
MTVGLGCHFGIYSGPSRDRKRTRRGISMTGLTAIEAGEGRLGRAINIAATAEQFTGQEGSVVGFKENNQAKTYLGSAKSKLSELEIENAEQLLIVSCKAICIPESLPTNANLRTLPQMEFRSRLR